MGPKLAAVELMTVTERAKGPTMRAGGSEFSEVPNTVRDVAPPERRFHKDGLVPRMVTLLEETSGVKSKCVVAGPEALPRTVTVTVAFRMSHKERSARVTSVGTSVPTGNVGKTSIVKAEPTSVPLVRTSAGFPQVGTVGFKATAITWSQTEAGAGGGIGRVTPSTGNGMAPRAMV